MANECEMMCEKCGERHATHHITAIMAGEEQTRNLCARCVEQDPSLTSLTAEPNLSDLLKTGKCIYCGAPPVRGSQSIAIGGPAVVHLYCAQCGNDLKEFAARPENQWEVPEIDDSLDNDAFLAEMTRVADRCGEIEKRKLEFMRMKVAQRGSSAT